MGNMQKAAAIAHSDRLSAGQKIGKLSAMLNHEIPHSAGWLAITAWVEQIAGGRQEG